MQGSMEMSEPVSASGDEGRRTVGGGLFCHAGRGGRRGDSSGDQGSTAAIIHLLLDSVLSAGALVLLNTTGRPPLWRCAGLQPCVNEVNIH